jgi:hypothetical protein
MSPVIRQDRQRNPDDHAPSEVSRAPPQTSRYAPDRERGRDPPSRIGWLLTRRPDDARRIARLTLATVAVAGRGFRRCGFILVVLGGLFFDFYLLGSLSLALLLANAPRYEAWETWLATPAPRP